MFINNKIAIIIHKRNERNYAICMESLRALNCPFEWDIKFYTTTAAGRNIAKLRENAQDEIEAAIKIYLEDDVWLLDEKILFNIVNTFNENSDIALIGLAGTNEVPVSGIAQSSWNIIGEISNESGKRRGEKITEVTDCLSVFGGFMALSVDVDWHSEDFSDSYFYDTAVTLELRRRGYRTVLISQSVPAVWGEVSDHDSIDEVSQKKFLDKYSQELFPLVSIVIPTYCRPKYFEEALRSALGQTYRNIEVFITDNSHDRRTADIIDSKYAKDPRVKYEHHPEINSALGNWLIARKYNNPNAEYVQWLMDDDILHPEKIAVMVDCYRMHPHVTLVTSYRQMIDADGQPMPDCVANKPIVDKNALLSGRAVGKSILVNMINFLGEPTTVLIRKKFLHNNDLGWTGEEGAALISDFPTWLNLCAQGDVIYLRAPYSWWRMHGDNQQSSLDIIHQGCVCWAMMIIYAWQKKIFLETSDELDAAVVKWFETAVIYLTAARRHKSISAWDNVFRQYFGYMSNYLLEVRNGK